MSQLEPLPASFWPKALLREFADDCIYHVMVPTVFITRPLPLSAYPATPDAEVDAAHQDFGWCSLCRQSLVACHEVQYGVRFLLGKRKARRVPDDGVARWMYRTAFYDAPLCAACVSAHDIKAEVDSSSAMFHLILDALESCDCIGMGDVLSGGVDLTGPEYWMCLAGLFQSSGVVTTSIAKGLCRMDPCCDHCNRPDPNWEMLVCGGCKYVRYCNRECSRARWPVHRHACKRLAQGQLFYDAIEVKK